jgi:uncharacterized protein YndB with AHSA1/START domain
MPKYDFLDEGIVDSPPMEVYKALLNEASGVTHWWMPDLEFRLRGGMPICEGAIYDIIGNSRGMKYKWSSKVTKLVEGKSIEEEYAGAIVGTGTWTFEPTDGKTKVQYRWNVRTNRLLFSIILPFVNMKKGHTEVIQKGFKACNSYLNQK